MKLTTRISLFFLVALAVVLAGMSCSIYLLVRGQLMRQVDEFSQSALDTLTAAVDFEPDGLEWESNVRRLTFAQAPGGGQLAWAIYDPDGHRLDGSPEAVVKFESQNGEPVAERVTAKDGGTWWLARRQLRGDAAANRSPTASPPAKEDEAKRWPKLVLSVGVPMDRALASLRPLAIALGVISLVIWTLSAIGGRWVSRRALEPVTRMAHAAGSISALDLSRRLPRSGTNDELDELGATFNELLDRLQISFEKQSRFASEASHQLRTPLAAILGQLDVALRRNRTTEQYREALAAARKQAEQLTRIVEMLLFLTREDADASSPALERVELRGWLCEHLQAWEQHARGRDIRIDAGSDDPLWVKVHGQLLGQALDNLLDNACKYSQPGSEISVSVNQIDAEVRLAVEDDGIGLAADELPHLGEAFFRSQRARARGSGGVGLGLAIVRRVLAAIGGQLHAKRRSGGGSRFVIVLPTASAGSFDQRSLTQPVASVTLDRP